MWWVATSLAALSAAGKLALRGGYDADWTSSTSETYFSPLAGINWRITENGVIKFLAARSSHSPDLVFTDLNWRYTVNNLSEPVDG